MFKITTIFFDVDNTLVNHSGAEKQGIDSIKEKYFPKISDKEFERVWIEETARIWQSYERKEITFQQQRTQRIQAIWKHIGRAITADLANEIFREYLACYEKSWKVFPGVLETLEKFKHQGIKLGILSNGNKNQQMQKLKEVGIYKFIDSELFIVSEDVGFAKPNQKIFSFAQHKTNAKHHTEILFIGDNPSYDIEPAIKIGWHTQLIDYFNKYPEHKSINNFTNLNIELFTQKNA